MLEYFLGKTRIIKASVIFLTLYYSLHSLGGYTITKLVYFVCFLKSVCDVNITSFLHSHSKGLIIYISCCTHIYHIMYPEIYKMCDTTSDFIMGTGADNDFRSDK